jgi:predicted nucleic acid-binding protein
VKNTLVDAGPLVAMFDPSDRFHSPVLAFIKEFRGGMLTTWPVMAEVCHLLGFSVDTQLNFLHWVRRGGLEIAHIESTEIDRIITLTEKYRDRPMDLADASLVVLAVNAGIRDILSLDADFDIYRLPDKTRLTNVLNLYS